MPPLPPIVSKAGLLRSKSGWNNSSLSLRSGTTVGLLSTRTPHGLGNSGGGIPNPSLGIGVTRLAMPRNAAGTYRPRVILSADTVTSYITYQGQRTIINPTAEVITQADMSNAYIRAGISGNTDPHTLTFGSGAHTIGDGGNNLGAGAATEVHFVGNRSGDLTIGDAAFDVYAGVGDVTSALTTVTFPASVGGNLTIDDFAFSVYAGGTATSALTTVTFPTSVGGNLTIGNRAFEVYAEGGAAISELTTVTFPASVGGSLTIGIRAFGGHTFTNATDDTKGVYFPTINYTAITVSGTPFGSADDAVRLNGEPSGAQLKLINSTTRPQQGRYYIL